MSQFFSSGGQGTAASASASVLLFSDTSAECDKDTGVSPIDCGLGCGPVNLKD